MRLAFIPARGGSKRIKNKNVLDFFGKPMLHYALSAAKDAGIFTKIHVSTDDHKIADVATSLGFAPEFLRPTELAGDYIPVLDVLRWVLKTYEGQSLSFSSIAVIMPCSPFLLAEDLVGAYRAYEENDGKHAVLSITKYPSPVEWAMSRGHDGLIRTIQDGSMARRSQDLGEAWYDSGAFSIQNAKAVLSQGFVVPSEYLGYEIPRDRSIDIDTPEDLHLARLLFAGRHALGNGP